MKEAAIKSTFCSHPNFKSWISFSAKAGKFTFTFGKLIPLFSPKSPEFSAIHSTSFPEIFVTVIDNSPSSTKTISPTFKSLANPS